MSLDSDIDNSSVSKIVLSNIILRGVQETIKIIPDMVVDIFLELGLLLRK